MEWEKVFGLVRIIAELQGHPHLKELLDAAHAELVKLNDSLKPKEAPKPPPLKIPLTSELGSPSVPYNPERKV